MNLIVQKFGGTSLANLDCIKHVASLVKAEIQKGNKVVVVVSAMAGVTNSLIVQCSTLSKLDKQINIREYDAAVSSGEIVSAALLALQLQNIGLNAKSLQAWQIAFQTDNMHGNAQVIDIQTKKIKELIDENIIPIVTGFQGVNNIGDITTLGKGGSDTSAALIAGSLNAKRCDIYTDVEGIYTADPRIVRDAKRIKTINVNQLYELCVSGAKILHPRAALAVKNYRFPMKILSSFKNNLATLVEIKRSSMENTEITAITSNKNLLKIDIKYKIQNLHKIIANLANASITIEKLYNLDNDNVCVILNLFDKNKSETLLNELKLQNLLKSYQVDSNISAVSIIGYNIKDSKLIGEIINILKNENIEILASDFSDIKISIIINDQKNEKLVKLLHDLLL